ncbi:MAG: F0F1 ATP synthase subunit gamma [Candidatus Omnitrophica bacterium]|nr:F0F1 ATP synthase subunit gamma [Candidatus Omnitrophota bacterium]
MPTIKELKEELQFDTELIGLLEVMKNTAVFQFRALQARMERFESFPEAVDGFFSLIGGAGNENILITPVTQKTALIIVTSDEGFMGSLNSQVIDLARLQYDFKEASLIIVGERGAHQLEGLGLSFTPYRSAADDARRAALAEELTGFIIRGVRKGEFGRVKVLYPKPVSFMYQKAEAVDILPLFKEVPRKRQPAPDARELITESPINGVIDYLAEKVIEQKLLNILEDSKLSEFAARAIHLESSSQELTEKRRKVKLQYFRAYHEMIDKSTRELFSAQIIIRRN